MTASLTSEGLAPGDAVLIDGTRARRVCLPGPPFACGLGGAAWLRAVVERERADGWVVATLDPRRSLRSWERRVVAPPEAVHPCPTRAA